PARSAVDHASHALENRRNKANSARSAVEMTRARFGISQNEANLHIIFTNSGDKYMGASPVASRKRGRQNKANLRYFFTKWLSAMDGRIRIREVGSSRANAGRGPTYSPR